MIHAIGRETHKGTLVFELTQWALKKANPMYIPDTTIINPKQAILYKTE